MINKSEIKLLQDCLQTLAAGFDHLPDGAATFDEAAIARVLDETAHRMRDNYPYYHPLYVGQMLKPPHPVARIAYAMSLWVNPNNHALDGGRASSAMEKECITHLAAMFGWDEPLGHLTGGGTMANLEALWIASRLHPGKHVIASAQAHYTHGRLSEVLCIPFDTVAVTGDGRLDINDVRRKLETGTVGTVVVTMGNTGLGAVDPLHDLIELRSEFDFRIHADAAYGGYFSLSSILEDRTQSAFAALSGVDSIVIDPHKHGLQPYGCGCVLFKDPSVGRYYKHGSPYTYFSSTELHLGEISLECSRPGASAVALWATQRLLPSVRDGEFAAGLDDCLIAARDFYARLNASESFTPLMPPELDIVVYAVNAATTSEASSRAQSVFENAANNELHLALMQLPSSLVSDSLPETVVDSETVSCLRSVFMKPEHKVWSERIVALLEQSLD